MGITVGIKIEEKIFRDKMFNTVKEIEYKEVDGFTFKCHEDSETCTGKGEQCLVVWLDGGKESATFPISIIEYVLTK